MLVVLGLVRTLPAPRTDGNCAAGYPVGPNTSSDVLRRSARCTVCGTKGATLKHPSWAGEQIGFAPFPVPKIAAEARPDE